MPKFCPKKWVLTAERTASIITFFEGLVTKYQLSHHDFVTFASPNINYNFNLGLTERTSIIITLFEGLVTEYQLSHYDFVTFASPNVNYNFNLGLSFA